MNRDLLLLGLSLFTWGIGEGMFLYFQPIYLQEWGADPVQIGVILGSMGIGMAVVQAPAGHLADRVGSRPVMWASWLTGLTAAAVMAFANSLEAFVVGLFLYGLTSFVVAPMNSYATSVRGKWSVARALTIISAFFNLGAVIGPILGGVIGTRYGLRTVYGIAAGIFVVSTLIILATRRPPLEEHTGEQHVSSSLFRYRSFTYFLPVAFLIMLATYMPQPLTPNFLQEKGLSLEQIGQLGAAGSLGNAVVMLALGFLPALRGIYTGMGLVALFMLLLWQGNSPLVFAIGYFFISGYRLCRSMALAFARPLIPPNRTGLAYGLVETANSLAIIAAPPLAGVLYDHDPRLMYSGGLILIAVIFLVSIVALPILQHSQPQKAVLPVSPQE